MSKVGAKEVAAAIGAWIEAMVAALPAKDPKLGKIAFAKNQIEVALPRHRKLRGRISAPLSLLAGVLMDADGAATDLVCVQPRGRSNRVLALLRDDRGGPAQASYLALLRVAAEAGAVADARLGLLLVRSVYDAHDRSDPLFATLFPGLPKRSGLAGSEAAFLERRLEEKRGTSAVDELVLALDLLDHAADAVSDVAGQPARLAKLVAAIDGAITALGASKELATRDIVRLVRQAIGHAFTYRYEQA